MRDFARKPALRSLAALAAVTLVSCTWVDLKPGAQDVLLLPEARVADCRNLGSVKVSVLEKVGFMQRHDEEVAEDLADLARNHAVEKGGDTIAALGPVTDGAQEYGIYRCAGTTAPKPDAQDGVETSPYKAD